MMIKKYENIVLWSEEPDPDILFSIFRKRLEIDLAMAKELVKARLEFSQGRPHYLIVDINNLHSITKEARDYMSSAKGGLWAIRAGAFVSTNIVTTLFANLYIRINKPLVPCMVFNTQKEALAWIHTERQKWLEERLFYP